jgi:transposase
MRKIREVLRLHHELHLSARKIASSCTLGRDTVRRYLERARAINFTWPPPADMDDATLEALFHDQPTAPPPPPSVKHELPDWAGVERELKRKGVTRLLLWREYIAVHPDGYQYSSFAQKFRDWKRSNGLNVTMRQSHKAGEKLFVDYAGMTVPITDRVTGEVNAAQVFVATLGASNYTYVEVTHTQNLEDWLGAHRRALEYFGGAPRVIVPDNLKTGVTSPHRYEPEINRAYTEFAEHYGVAIIPTRVRKPRDKAKVEVHVQIVERELLAPLRNRTFFDLADANTAVRERLEALNDRPFQKLSGSRRSAFLELDQPELRPCRPSRTRCRSGAKPGSASITTSRSTGITTACITATRSRTWRCAWQARRSRSSTRARASPRMCERRTPRGSKGGTRPSPSTCPNRTSVTTAGTPRG